MPLPNCFVEKIEIDRRIKSFMDRPVIPIREHAALKVLKDERDRIRRGCEWYFRPMPGSTG